MYTTTASSQSGKLGEFVRHESYLRTLISNGFSPIYIGDRVRVSARYGDGKTLNPDYEKSGTVVGLEATMQSMFNIDYLAYVIKADDGKVFDAYYYTLDRIDQAKGNKLLEKLLREQARPIL